MNRSEIIAAIDAEIKRLEEARRLLREPAPRKRKATAKAKKAIQQPMKRKRYWAAPKKRYSGRGGGGEISGGKGRGGVGDTEDGGYGRERD